MQFSHGVFIYWIFTVAAAFALPEYALRTKVSCSACHSNPFGGGPRTVFGKVYGSHGYDRAETSGSDTYYGDFRVIAHYPLAHIQERKNGVALMVASASAQVPILKRENGGGLTIVSTLDVGSLSGGAISRFRETYVKYTLPSSTGLLTQFTLGRTYVPFGLMTDEHRTYTHMQTPTSIRDFEMGAGISQDFSTALHYDVFFSTGFQSAGKFSPNDVSYAATTNLRWNPPGVPALLGFSTSYHHQVRNPPFPYALAFYSVVSPQLDSLVSWGNEFTFARYWNQKSGMIAGFFLSSSPEFQNQVNESQSMGISEWFRVGLSEVVSLIYKFDYVAFDVRYPNDGFIRHGVGFRFFINSNVAVESRIEKAFAMHPVFKDAIIPATEDAFWSILRVWL